MALTKVIGAGLGTLTGNADLDGAVDMASTLTVGGNTTLNGKFLIDGSNNDLMTFRTTGDTASQVLGLQFQNNSEAVTAQIFGTGDNSSSGVFRIKGIGNVDIIGGDVGVTGASADLRVHSGGVVSIPNGVELGSGVDATSANILDDYEEGTWTPTADGGSTTYSTQSGLYTKIGNIVYAKFNLEINNFAGSVRYLMGGLPFNSFSSGGGSGSILYFANIHTSAVALFTRTDSNGSTVFISGTTGSSGTIANINHNWANNSANIIGHIIYQTA